MYWFSQKCIAIRYLFRVNRSLSVYRCTPNKFHSTKVSFDDMFILSIIQLSLVWACLCFYLAIAHLQVSKQRTALSETEVGLLL